MDFGAEFDDGAVRFRLWAPAQQQVQLLAQGHAPRPMQRTPEGWHELSCVDLPAGTLYRFGLADGLEVPDPASRFQPLDVHGPSEVIDPLAFRWSDAGWSARPWEAAVLYELHVGCFTPQGGFRGVVDQLDYLKALGVTTLELMPVADFPGRRGWGYDAVLPFAPHSAYGRPEDLKALVDAAHARGLAVLLDVVYNHFGPDGNYTGRYWPQLMTDEHHTPWGAAINFDRAGSGPVREYFIQNALYWLEEYHFDGLRLDAVHAIVDGSAQHVIDAITARAAARFGAERRVHIVLENEDNDAARLAPAGGATAQWNDDVHHGLHVALTGESEGYYADYRAEPGLLPRSLAEGFAFQGERMQYRGRARGMPSAHLPPSAFIAFLQNHDQVGNRAFGERIGALAPAAAVRAAAAIYLLAPQVPMLFMGEEWAASTPFLYFCDMREPLASAIRDGRRREFAGFGRFSAFDDVQRIPDPNAESTFRASCLDWPEAAAGAHAAALDWHRRILAVRRTHIVPLLARMESIAGRWQWHGAGFSVRWRAGAAVLTLLANLSAERVQLALPQGELLWSENLDGSRDVLPPWAIAWQLQAAGQ
jgi:maltooligosyltrehalose trehalohydrolase